MTDFNSYKFIIGKNDLLVRDEENLFINDEIKDENKDEIKDIILHIKNILSFIFDIIIIYIITYPSINRKNGKFFIINYFHFLNYY